MTDLPAPAMSSSPSPPARHRLHLLFPVLPERLAIGAGLRGALALIPFVIAGAREHQSLWGWATFAAFWTCLGDPNGAIAARMRTMVLFAVSGALVAACYSGLAIGGPWVGAPALFALVLACGAVGRKRPAYALTATLIAVVGAVALEQPMATARMPWVAAAFIAGGAIALALLIGVNARPASPLARRTDDRAAPLRRAIAVVVVYALGHWQHLLAMQWATMAGVVVTHGDMGNNRPGNWPRACERMVGSLIGGVAALSLASIPTPVPLQLGEVFVLAAATLAVRQVNYTLFVSFLTPLFVLVVGMILPGPGGAVLALARAADNLFGSLIAMLVCELLLVSVNRSIGGTSHC